MWQMTTETGRCYDVRVADLLTLAVAAWSVFSKTIVRLEEVPSPAPSSSALASPALPATEAAAAAAYNLTPYEQRGWCYFEREVSVL